MHLLVLHLLYKVIQGRHIVEVEGLVVLLGEEGLGLVADFAVEDAKPYRLCWRRFGRVVIVWMAWTKGFGGRSICESIDLIADLLREREKMASLAAVIGLCLASLKVHCGLRLAACDGGGVAIDAALESYARVDTSK